MSDFRTASKNTWLRRPSFFITLGALFYALFIVVLQGDSTALVTLGTRFTEGIPEEAGGTEGYDGQFVYFIARDPATAAFFMAQGGDIPAYRYQRILLPTLGRGLALGHESLIPYTLLAVNLLALFIGGMLLETYLREHGMSRWYVVGYALSLGVFGTVRLSLSEPLAYGLVIAGIFAMTRDKWLWSAWLFALAVISKETTLVFVAGYGLWMLLNRQWMRAIWFLGISVIPFIILQWILYQIFGAFGVGSGGALATSFEVIPFGGVLKIITTIIEASSTALTQPDANIISIVLRAGVALFIFGIILGFFVLLPTLWGLRRVFWDMRGNSVDIWSILLGINALVMLFVPFSTYREPLGILRFIVGLQITVILYSIHRGNKQVLRNSTFWMFTLLLLVSSDLGSLSA